MLQWRRWQVLLEIVGVNAQEMPVGSEKEGGESVCLDRVSQSDRTDELGGDDCANENQGSRRNDPPDSPRIEAEERYVVGAFPLAQQQTGDQEAGDDEENIDAGKPAGRPMEEVIEDHGEDRECAQTLYVPAPR